MNKIIAALLFAGLAGVLQAAVENLPVGDSPAAKDVPYGDTIIPGFHIDAGVWQQDRQWMEMNLRNKLPRACNTCVKITYEATGFNVGLVGAMSPSTLSPTQVGVWVKPEIQVVVFRVDGTKQFNVYPKLVDPPYLRTVQWEIPAEFIDGKPHTVCSAAYKPGPRDPVTGKLTWALVGALDNVSCSATATKFVINIPQ